MPVELQSVGVIEHGIYLGEEKVALTPITSGEVGDIPDYQTEDDYLILNYDDEITKNMAKDKRVCSKVVYFSRLNDLQEGICLKDNH